jgi:hypothetical protein
MDDELITIAAAAKRLGLSRPRLSAYIKDSGLQKVSKNGVQLVAYGQVCSLVQTLSAQGKMRVRGATRRDNGRGTKHEGSSQQLFGQMNRLFERLQDENEKLRVANDGLADRVRALEAENSQLKLLPAGQQHREVNNAQIEQDSFLKTVLRKSKAITRAIRD